MRLPSVEMFVVDMSRQNVRSSRTRSSLGGRRDRIITNPAGERSLAISDGRGRSVRSVQLAANGDAIVSLLNPHRARPNSSLPRGYESQ